MKHYFKMLKKQVFSWNPILLFLDRIFRFATGVTLIATSIIFIWRAGATGLHRGAFGFPAVPTFWVVVTGVMLMPTAVLWTAKSLLPENADLPWG